MSKSLIDHAVLMRSVLGEPVMEMDVPDRDEGQSVVQAKLSRHIRLKSPAPICDEEPLLTVHSDDEPPPARRRKRSIKSKATVESDDEEDNSVFVDKASSKTRSHRGARESIVDMEAVESEEELPKDPKGKGKASVKKDVVNRIQRSKASPDTRQKALAAIQAFGKEYPGFLSSSGTFNFAGDEPIDIKQEAKEGGSRDASNKRRNKKKVSHRETPQSEDLPEVADMFKALDQPAKERRKYLERKPKSSANVDGPILQEYCEAGHPLHILYLKHPNTGLPSFVAFLSFAHEDMFANIGNCDPDTFELLKYQTATGSTGHNLVFRRRQWDCCVAGSWIVCVVFGFREKSVAFTTVEVDDLTKAGVSSPRSSPVKSTSMFASTPSTPSRSSPSKPVQPIAYPATQPFAAAIPIYDATGALIQA
ncbi:hypothetical protein BDZ89DRAFT_1041836 [Hymenopellis radicata]|nr:hypothetical protein BDZ89DRAFT_1041836 [Hymenopellis radicata]